MYIYIYLLLLYCALAKKQRGGFLLGTTQVNGESLRKSLEDLDFRRMKMVFTVCSSHFTFYPSVFLSLFRWWRKSFTSPLSILSNNTNDSLFLLLLFFFYNFWLNKLHDEWRIFHFKIHQNNIFFTLICRVIYIWILFTIINAVIFFQVYLTLCNYY